MKFMHSKVVHSIGVFVSFIRRWRTGCACMLGLAAFLMLFVGLGLTRLLPLPGTAVADDAPRARQTAPESLLAPDQARLLQASVDSVVLGMSGALGTMPDDAARQKALGAALDALTFDLGGEVYFTAWQDTQLVHSPLSPDAAARDFGEALDERGASFVREMEGVATLGGGFIAVTLPRQLPRPVNGLYSAPVRMHSADTPLRMNLDAAAVTRAVEELSATIMRSAGALPSKRILVQGHIHAVSDTAVAPSRSGGPVSPAPEATGRAPGKDRAALVSPADPRPLFDSTPVEQVVYVRAVPGTDWHVAAFMPGASAGGQTGFSSVLSGRGENGLLNAQNRFRQGMCFSGLSLAGLAGLLLVPSARSGGRNEEEPSAKNSKRGKQKADSAKA